MQQPAMLLVRFACFNLLGRFIDGRAMRSGQWAGQNIYQCDCFVQKNFGSMVEKIPSETNVETRKLIIKEDVTKTYINTVQYVVGR